MHPLFGLSQDHSTLTFLTTAQPTDQLSVDSINSPAQDSFHEPLHYIGDNNIGHKSAFTGIQRHTAPRAADVDTSKLGLQPPLAGSQGLVAAMEHPPQRSETTTITGMMEILDIDIINADEEEAPGEVTDTVNLQPSIPIRPSMIEQTVRATAVQLATTNSTATLMELSQYLHAVALVSLTELRRTPASDINVDDSDQYTTGSSKVRIFSQTIATNINSSGR